MEIKVLKNVMIKNNAIGNDNRRQFTKNGILAINIISSPGAGKTTLIENSISELCKKYRIAVIEGDLFTSKDAERLATRDVPVVQINTEGGCHLDAKMVSAAIGEFDLEKLDLVIIENVGNLVCPASFDLGEHMRVLVYSITEGDDKPAKYATIFKQANVIIINKIELSEICNISLEVLEKEVRKVNPVAKIFRVSATRKETLAGWIDWLGNEIEKFS
ncbi:MAG: hydrogenase nickel incorporation protein HypB [Oligoflexia bacterium]|nr:hydrogenase nickel incorporation protein HypB [Oligoflexia bacterium]